MFHAVSYALLDSLNVLLIGVLFALAVLHARTGKYGKIALLLVAGDWFGVFLLSLLALFVFVSLGDMVQSFLESPVLGIVLIVVGLVSAVLTARGGDPTPMIRRVTAPLTQATPATFGLGMVLGLIQSVTSIPFFLGLAHLSTTDFTTVMKFAGIFLYATLALSLPIMFGLLLGFIRRYPESAIALFIERMGEYRDQLTAASGYIVAAVLIVIGVMHLL